MSLILPYLGGNFKDQKSPYNVGLTTQILPSLWGLLMKVADPGQVACVHLVQGPGRVWTRNSNSQPTKTHIGEREEREVDGKNWPARPMWMSESYRAGVTFYHKREAKTGIRGLGPSWAFTARTGSGVLESRLELCFMVVSCFSRLANCFGWLR